jgi:hypothetical protein
MSDATSDPGLLAVARRVLTQHGFRVSERPLESAGEHPVGDAGDNVTWLLAESDYFLLGVASGESFEDLLVLEGFVAAALGALVDQSDLGSKRWDFYVVLLSSADTNQRGAPDVVRLQYNTRSLRRLVSLGIPAREDAVAEALATFLPLPEPPPGGLPSAFEELVAQLVINGIPQGQAASGVKNYRERGSIDAD